MRTLSQLGWTYHRLTGFDLETTSTDPETARIVTGSVVQSGGGRTTAALTWVSDLGGAEIPAEATQIHGFTTEAARTAGRPAAAVVEEITAALAAAVEEGRPLVIMNASYDLTVVDREARRYGVTPLGDRVSPVVLDPYVLDKRVRQYRRGGRTLADLCRHYVVPLEGAHSSEADAVAVCALVRKMGRRYRVLDRLTVDHLHQEQVGWAREQREDLRDYFARTPGKEEWAKDVRLEWPLLPFHEPVSER
ncbi:exonuclease domain-containing protein [Streptomyces fuscigenes]|uniref:exonuclease domain-containing protein n=1 Tax=Streptomyces fuscigenes TaxID=1528880 RepID=UPI001F17A7B7|nr:exonuclease domain-containing protein [Streptomyces fuscigenes]MCF3960335.1 3'-5' exonuclease [Streptomyces fuscigenes]